MRYITVYNIDSEYTTEEYLKISEEIGRSGPIVMGGTMRGSWEGVLGIYDQNTLASEIMIIFER